MTARMKLRRPSAKTISEAGYDVSQEDPREQDARQIIQSTDDGRVILEDLFAGTDLIRNRQKVSLILSVRSEVIDHWGKAKTAFLAIGRALLLLDEDPSLTDGERAALKRGSGRLFPFSDTVASQLRQVARSVRDGRIPEAACPSSYSIAYQLCVMPDEDLVEAGKADLIRPNVTRTAIIQFRRLLRERSAITLAGAEGERLRRLQAELERERGRLQMRLAQVEAELSEVLHRMQEVPRARRG